MERQAILYPLFMMVILTLAVVYGQFFINLQALRKKDVRLSFFKLFKSDGDTPHYMEAARMHYRNMFEVPILFYVLVLYIYFSNNITSGECLFRSMDIKISSSKPSTSIFKKLNFGSLPKIVFISLDGTLLIL